MIDYYKRKPNDGEVYLYTLSDPTTNEIRYVGKTIQSLNCRLASHNCRNRRNKNHTEAWIKSLKVKELKPNIELIDIVSNNDWIFEEKFYISYFKFLGFNLTNHSLGGDKSNFGSKWKRTKDTQNKLDIIISSRNYDLTLLNIYTSEKLNFKNFKEISFYLKKSYKKIYANFNTKSLIDKTYIILKPNEEYNINNKIGVKKVFATNIYDDTIIKAESFIELSKILKCSKSLLGKYLKNKKLIHNKYIINYDSMPK